MENNAKQLLLGNGIKVSEDMLGKCMHGNLFHNPMKQG